MDIETFLARDETLGLILLALLVMLWARNRSFVREISEDASRGWRIVARMATGMAIITILWISFLDNWRQLTAIPFQASRQWQYQRVQIDPPSAEIRAITFILLAATLVLVSALMARHIGGYFLQFALLMGALAGWLPFFVIRQRFTLDLAMGFTGSWTSPTDVAAYLGFVVLSWGFDLGLILISFVALLGAVALPTTLVLDLLRLRRPKITQESRPFFNAIGHRVPR
jgi:hypothetical protein